MRYVVGKPAPPRMGWDDDAPETARTAHIEERPDMQDTGLLDGEGRKLYREREPFGFKPR